MSFFYGTKQALHDIGGADIAGRVQGRQAVSSTLVDIEGGVVQQLVDAAQALAITGIV